MPATDRCLFHPSVTSVPTVTYIDDLHIETSLLSSTCWQGSGHLQKPVRPFQRVLGKRYLSRCSAILWTVLACTLLFMLPCVSGAMAASITLAWDANDPVPDGYRLFRRVENQAYNYSQPVWSGRHDHPAPLMISSMAQRITSSCAPTSDRTKAGTPMKSHILCRPG